MCNSVKYFLLRILHAAVGIHQLVNHILADNTVYGQVLDIDISDTFDRFSADAYVNLNDLSLEIRLQFLYDVGQGLYGFVDIIHNALADARGRILLYDSENADAAVKILLSCNTRHLG